MIGIAQLRVAITPVATMSKASSVTINLTNYEGKILKTYVGNVEQAKGDYQLELNLPTDLPAGTYFINFLSSGKSNTFKIIHG